MTGAAPEQTLRTEGLTVEFGGLRALDDVSLELRVGEVLGLLGPNGAGKTTLVNVISGFSRPTRGEVLLDGTRVTHTRPALLARHGIVRTFQSVRLFRRLSVRENVVLPTLGQKKRSADAAVQAMEFVGIAPIAHRIAGELAYAQERLVGIARALAAMPRFLLLDEPAAGMNEMEGAQLADLVGRIASTFGCGVLLIEHNIPVVMAVCERLHVLRSGKTLAVGSRDEVRNNRDVIDSYLGRH